jgi:hypothetical protein
MLITAFHKKSFLVVIASIMSAITYSSADIDVLIGIYGSLNKNGMTSKFDITKQLRSKISNNSLRINKINDIDKKKKRGYLFQTTLVIYRNNTDIKLVYTKEDESLEISENTAKNHPTICTKADLTGNADALKKFGIIKAYYGDLETSQPVNMNSSRITEVTNKIFTDNNGYILCPANNAVYGDPAYGTGKNLLIIYAVYGTLCIKFISEGSDETIKPDYASANALYYLT